MIHYAHARIASYTAANVSNTQSPAAEVKHHEFYG
jgi:hypothetical protein